MGIKKWWGYTKAKVDDSFEKKADPRIQLEQAITEAQDQHRRLREQAATVIANQKQAELRLNRTLGELEKVNGNARQALRLSAASTQQSDVAKAQEYDRAAETLANRMIQLEHEVDDLKDLALSSARASEQAKQAVQQNAQALQQKLAERQKLLSQLDQAKMQESLNSAMAQLSLTVGEDTPSFEQIRTKIEARYAQATASAELQGQSVETTMLEIERAAANTEAIGRLEEMRAQMGLAAGPSPQELLSTSPDAVAERTSDSTPQRDGGPA